VALSSWVPGADRSGFPAEHLPYGVFSTAGDPGDPPRVGVRIGDSVLDLARLADTGLVEGPFDRPALNPFLALGPDRWAATRARLTQLVCDTSSRSSITTVDGALVPADEVTLHLPIEVADYVDFYSSIEHATNMGRLLRPGSEPLLPNWRHLPVAYHGRAGTVVVSGTPIVRPSGQRRSRSPDGSPDGPVVFGPTTRLDIELEVGFVVGTPSSQGRPVPVERAADHVFGIVLVNDWSARDIQAWEYQPLGPFLGKSFATTVSGWVTPLAALDSCRVAGPAQRPEPLPYLRTDAPWGLALDLSVDLRPSGARSPTTVSRTSFAGLYWTIPQQIAHLTVNGASLRTGDLLASGTVSGASPGSEGSLMELTSGGAAPIDVGGVARTFLEDGDEVVLRGSARVAAGVVLTLGSAAGRIVPGSVA
jgi:fumarylacetoacetase